MSSQTLISIVVLAMALANAGCSDGGSVEQADHPETPEVSERVALLMGGWPHARAITETGKATAYRILNPEDPREQEKIGPGVELTHGQRDALARLLAREDAYAWDVSKGCEPLPGVLVTFEDGATYARVRFCFSCQMLEYMPSHAGWEDFDPIYAELVDWLKGVFPDDEAVQKLGTPEQEQGL